VPLFISRWQNGDFSAVSASSKQAAIELLDEVGNAEDCEVFIAKDFMVHFQLKKEFDDLARLVPVTLEGFGEKTEEMLLERAYPIYDGAVAEVIHDLNDEAPREKWDAARKKVNDALTTERDRLWAVRKRKLSDDADVAKLQQTGDLPKVMAERVGRGRRQRRIVEMPPSSDKVQ